MTTDADIENWEEALDRELTAAGRAPNEAGPAKQPSPTGGASTEDALPQLGASRATAELDPEDMRREIFDGIRQGAALSVDICDPDGRVLLAAGSRVTREFIQHLREIGLQRVRLRPAGATGPIENPELAEIDPGRVLHTPISRKLDERLVGELQRTILFRPVKAWRRPRLPITDLKERAVEGVERHAATATAVAELCESLKPGKRVSVDVVQRSVHQFVNMATTDFDLLPLIASLQQSGNEYLYDHCVNVCLVSVALASQLGLHREEIVTIGLAGLLGDVGMLRVPDEIRLKPGQLTDREWLEVKRHPLHTLDMLSDLRGLPPTVNFVVYQVHERMDGSGYPRGRRGKQLHQYARLVALADVYSAMIRHRPYRRAHRPYDTATTILRDGAANKFDRELVRAFLDTVSLFPIGSVVGLSDGTQARVLRANPGLHTRPVVEQLSPDGTPTGQILDLSHEDAPHVVRAV